MKALVSAEINYSPKMLDALELIKNKAINGKWLNENRFKSPLYFTLYDYREQSKWLTLYALEVLKF